MQSKIFTVLIGLSLCLTSFSQTTELQKIDNELTNSFKTMISAETGIRYDSLAPAFKKQLLVYLTNPVTFNNTLDSLSKYMTITKSADKKIIFYSWDERSGGSWHIISCIAQFKSDKGRVIAQELSSEDETGNFSDIGIFDVYDFVYNNDTFYLTFAWGTHGSGQQHKVIQLFQIKGDILERCTSCFINNEEVVIKYPRSETANILFDQKKKQIKYPSFEYNEDTGVYKPTGNTLTLTFKNGAFIRE